MTEICQYRVFNVQRRTHKTPSSEKGERRHNTHTHFYLANMTQDSIVLVREYRSLRDKEQESAPPVASTSANAGSSYNAAITMTSSFEFLASKKKGDRNAHYERVDVPGFRHLAEFVHLALDKDPELKERLHEHGIIALHSHVAGYEVVKYA